jgi:hypothetical protein
MHSFEVERSYIEAECREVGEADLAREQKRRVVGRKDGWADHAICPGCGQIYTREDLAHLLKTKGYYRCTCDYEHGEKPFRPLTIREIQNGQFRTRGQRPSSYGDVDLEGYTRALLQLASKHDDG